MTPVPGEPVPRPARETDTVRVEGLAPNTTYFFRLKAADEVPNWSEASDPVAAAIVVMPPIGNWYLLQNDPNPFCESTDIRFALSQDAHVRLEILNRDATAVVRLLVDIARQAGVYVVRWDSRDAGDSLVPAGDYPHRLIVGEDPPLFLDTKVASKCCTPPCATAITPGTWSQIKTLYRR